MLCSAASVDECKTNNGGCSSMRTCTDTNVKQRNTVTCGNCPSGWQNNGKNCQGLLAFKRVLKTLMCDRTSRQGQTQTFPMQISTSVPRALTRVTVSAHASTQTEDSNAMTVRVAGQMTGPQTAQVGVE